MMGNYGLTEQVSKLPGGRNLKKALGSYEEAKVGGGGHYQYENSQNLDQSNIMNNSDFTNADLLNGSKVFLNEMDGDDMMGD